MAMNEALRKYVKENEEKLSKRYNQSIEIYDWEKKAHAYDKCNRADFESRFKILTTALSEKHQMFIVKQEPNSHGYEQNDSNKYDSQDYDSKELQG
uniref:Cathepsin propeptide inhibitor domain-containing protein n=1 Tax=Panagrolaimus sp. PS1159 TaxID=55785 RepID=A0AC35GPV1_9BILA